MRGATDLDSMTQAVQAQQQRAAEAQSQAERLARAVDAVQVSAALTSKEQATKFVEQMQDAIKANDGKVVDALREQGAKWSETAKVASTLVNPNQLANANDERARAAAELLGDMQAFRDDLVENLRTHLESLQTEQTRKSGELVKETGSKGAVRDLDLQLLGPNASENRDEAQRYLAEGVQHRHQDAERATRLVAVRRPCRSHQWTELHLSEAEKRPIEERMSREAEVQAIAVLTERKTDGNLVEQLRQALQVDQQDVAKRVSEITALRDPEAQRKLGRAVGDAKVAESRSSGTPTRPPRRSWPSKCRRCSCSSTPSSPMRTSHGDPSSGRS